MFLHEFPNFAKIKVGCRFRHTHGTSAIRKNKIIKKRFQSLRALIFCPNIFLNFQLRNNVEYKWITFEHDNIILNFEFSVLLNKQQRRVTGGGRLTCFMVIIDQAVRNTIWKSALGKCQAYLPSHNMENSNNENVMSSTPLNPSACRYLCLQVRN